MRAVLEVHRPEDAVRLTDGKVEALLAEALRGRPVAVDASELESLALEVLEGRRERRRRALPGASEAQAALVPGPEDPR